MKFDKNYSFLSSISNYESMFCMQTMMVKSWKTGWTYLIPESLTQTKYKKLTNIEKAEPGDSTD